MQSTRQWKSKRRKLTAIGCGNFLKEESTDSGTTSTLTSVCEGTILQINSSNSTSGESSTQDFRSNYTGAVVDRKIPFSMIYNEAKNACREQTTIFSKSLSKDRSFANGSSKKGKSILHKKQLQCLGRKKGATTPSHSKLQSGCKSVSNLDLSNSMTCTPSYRLLPIKYMRQASFLHPLRAQVLNDHWACVPSDRQNFNLRRTKKNFYEEKLQECEDNCCEVDVRLESTRAAISRMEVLLNKLDSSEDVSLVDNHLTVIDWHCCDRLDDECGLRVEDMVRKDPCTVLPVVIDKLKQKQENLLITRESLRKTMKEFFLGEDAKLEVKKGCRRS